MATRYITRLILHCAATPNGRSFDAEDIDLWHQARGFKRNTRYINEKYPLKYIGYHKVILSDGSVENGRQTVEIGAHCKGYNANSLGVCLVGTDHFTLEQWKTLKDIIVAYRKQLPPFLIHGHNEFNSHKTCPGFDVQAYLNNKMEPLFKHILLENE